VFDYRNFIPRERTFCETGVVRKRLRLVPSDTVKQQMGVEKVEEGVRFRIHNHHVQNRSGFREFDLQPNAWVQILQYVTNVTVYPAEHFDYFALLEAVQSRDEALVLRIECCSATGQ